MMTSQQLAVRQADSMELDTVMDLLKERIGWLRAQGSDQWSTWETWRTKIPAALKRGHVWLLTADHDPIGTITVEFRGDNDFWTPAECAEPAAYLSKLAIRLDSAGRELGQLLTSWASDYAYRAGSKFVRLDAWKTNDRLRAYYTQRGWKYLRTVDAPGRNSGSLFQMPTQPLSHSLRTQLDEDFPVTVLDGTHGGPLDTDPDVAGNWRPTHVHRGGMKVQYDVLEHTSEALFVDFMRYRVHLEQGEWLLSGTDGHFTDWRRQGVVLGSNAQLSPEKTYVVTHQQLIDKCQVIVTPMPSELATACVSRPANLDDQSPHPPAHASART